MSDIHYDKSDWSKIYLDPKLKKFFRLISMSDNGCIIGRLCDTYHDAMAQELQIRCSLDFVNNSIKVINIDEVADYNGYGWVAK